MSYYTSSGVHSNDGSDYTTLLLGLEAKINETNSRLQSYMNNPTFIINTGEPSYRTVWSSDASDQRYAKAENSCWNVEKNGDEYTITLLDAYKNALVKIGSANMANLDVLKLNVSDDATFSKNVTIDGGDLIVKNGTINFEGEVAQDSLVVKESVTVGDGSNGDDPNDDGSITTITGDSVSTPTLEVSKEDFGSTKVDGGNIEASESIVVGDDEKGTKITKDSISIDGTNEGSLTTITGDSVTTPSINVDDVSIKDNEINAPKITIETKGSGEGATSSVTTIEGDTITTGPINCTGIISTGAVSCTSLTIGSDSITSVALSTDTEEPSDSSIPTTSWVMGKIGPSAGFKYPVGFSLILGNNSDPNDLLKDFLPNDAKFELKGVDTKWFQHEGQDYSINWKYEDQYLNISFTWKPKSTTSVPISEVFATSTDTFVNVMCSNPQSNGMFCEPIQAQIVEGTSLYAIANTQTVEVLGSEDVYKFCTTIHPGSAADPQSFSFISEVADDAVDVPWIVSTSFKFFDKNMDLMNESIVDSYFKPNAKTMTWEVVANS